MSPPTPQQVLEIVRAAEAGRADAQRALADIYRDGFGVTRSFRTALKWYRRCAPSDREARKRYYAEILRCFGDYCHSGERGPADYAQAARWYGRAAALGHPVAQSMLADLYLTGRGVARDPDRAHELFLKAARQGDQQALDRLFAASGKLRGGYRRWFDYETLRSKAPTAAQEEIEALDGDRPGWEARAVERLKDSSVFCILPWTHLSAWPNGDVYPCCATWKAPPLGNLGKDSLTGLWNSARQRQLRLNMLEGKRSPECSRCYEAEGCGAPSQRQRMNRAFPHHYPRAERTAPDGGAGPMRLVYLDFRFSNVCNFRCRTCGPTFSSSWQDDHAALEGSGAAPALLRPGAPEKFWDGIEELLPGLEEIYFAGGEPLLMEEHFRILDFLVKRKLFHVRLLYSTNFSMTHFQDHDIFALWDKFETVHVGASIDAMGPQGEYIRKGQRWADVEANLAHLKRVCPRAQLNLVSTLSALNSLCLPELQADWLRHGHVEPKNMLVNLVMTPEHYSLQILPRSLKKRVREKYEAHIRDVLEPHGAEAASPIDYLKAALEYMDARERPEDLAKFRQVTAKLDGIRGESFTEVFPDLRQLLQ